MENRTLDAKQIARLRCEACGLRMMGRMPQTYEEEVSHDGRPPVRIIILDVPAIACTNPACSPDNPDHSVIFDDAATWHITVETYRQLGLLTPDEIRQGRERLGMNQQELQELLGLGGNSLSRWENGRVYQSRSSDTLLRIVLSVPEAVYFLRRLRPPASQEPSQRPKFPYLDERQGEGTRGSSKTFSPKEFLAIIEEATS